MKDALIYGYSREDLLEQHKPECQGVGQTAVKIVLPEEGENKLSFRGWQKQMPAICVIYADFEALTTKITGPALDPAKNNTQKTQKHEACGFGYVVVWCDGLTESPVAYRGPDAAIRFLNAIQGEEKKIRKILTQRAPINMTREDKEKHNAAVDCHICEKPLIVSKYLDSRSVSEFDYNSGIYLGEMHNKCHFKQHAQFIGCLAKRKGKPDTQQTNCIACKEPLMKENHLDSVRDHCHVRDRAKFSIVQGRCKMGRGAYFFWGKLKRGSHFF